MEIKVKRVTAQAQWVKAPVLQARGTCVHIPQNPLKKPVWFIAVTPEL